jgi:hypothetical protein
MTFLSGKKSVRCHYGIYILVLALSLLSIFPAGAQRTREEPPPLSERLFYGGNFGLQFGSITDIQVSPVIGIWLLPRLAVAVGPSYRYYKDWDLETSIYGGKGYVQFAVIKDFGNLLTPLSGTGIFLRLEDEFLSLETSVWKDQNLSGRYILNTVLGGVGISQQMGRKASLELMGLWALNGTDDRLYGNPEIRVSFVF